ncbi:MAG: hypothetical protein WB780_09220 [Candidatus Acidiferrales bacterium]
MNEMEKNTNHPEAADALARHSRKCSICHHPDREAIEQDFLHWSTSFYIQQEYDINDARSIYCHARATGLIQRRRENLLAALDNLVEQSAHTVPSADGILRAIRAYSCLDEYGRWTDPPSRVFFSTSQAAPIGPSGSSVPGDATQTITIPAPKADQTGEPLLGPDPSELSVVQPPQDIPAAQVSAEDENLIPVSRLEVPLSD